MKSSVNIKIIRVLILLIFFTSSYESCNSAPVKMRDKEPVNSAQILYSTGKLTEAEKILVNAINKNPKNFQAFLELSKIYLNSNKVNKAKETLSKATKLNQNSSEVYALTALLLYKDLKFNEAAFTAKKALQINQKNALAYLVLGKVFLSKGQYKESFRNFYLASKYDPSDPEAHIGIAKIYLDEDKTSASFDEILKANELDIKNGETLFFIGEFFFKTGKYELSLKNFKKSLQYSATDNFKTHFYMGVLYEKLGDIELAIQEYAKTLRLRPDHDEAKERLGELQKEFKEISEAITPKEDPLKNLVWIVDSDVNTLIHADQALITEQYTEARNSYLKVLKKNSNNLSALSGLLEMYYTLYLDNKIDNNKFFLDNDYLRSISNDVLPIAYYKYKLINNNNPESIDTSALKELTRGESSDFYERLSSIRACFILKDYQSFKIKLNSIIETGISSSEKLKLVRFLYFDRAYGDVNKILTELNDSNYENMAKTIIDRANLKIEKAQKFADEGIYLYKEKDYSNAIIRFEESIKIFPTLALSHLYYAFTLEKMGNTEEALDKIYKYKLFEELYPSKEPAISQKQLQKTIKKWELQIAN